MHARHLTTFAYIPDKNSGSEAEQITVLTIVKIILAFFFFLTERYEGKISKGFFQRLQHIWTQNIEQSLPTFSLIFLFAFFILSCKTDEGG